MWLTQSLSVGTPKTPYVPDHGASGNYPLDFEQPARPTVQQVADELQHYASAFSYGSRELNGEMDSLETIETRKPTAEMPDGRIGVS
jgi:hypothetical protein